jgi:hypothetical protein
MTAWWMIVTAAGLFVVLILVLRALPARPGSAMQDKAGSVRTAPNPVHDHDAANLPFWHIHHGGGGDPGPGDLGPGSAVGSTSETGSGAGGGRDD